MVIKVMSRANATEFFSHLHKERFAVISISDIDCENPVFVKEPLHRLKLHFADVEIEQPDCITDEQANEISRFVFSVRDDVDMIIVHCMAGISRSAGVAAAIMKFLNNDDWDIFGNPKYCPNRTCYRKVLNALHDPENQK